MQKNINKVTSQFVALFFAGIALFSHTTRAAVTEGVKGAAYAIATDLAYYDQLRQLCGDAIPTEKKGLAVVYFHWLDQNRKEVLGMRAWRLTEGNLNGFDDAARISASAKLAPIQQMKPDQRLPACVLAFRDLGEGSKDFNRNSPEQSTLLINFLNQHPLNEQQAREYDNPVGCAKRMVQAGGDLDRARPLCQCNWQAANESWSSEEWREFEAGATDGRSAQELAQLPQVRRVASKLSACTTKFLMVAKP